MTAMQKQIFDDYQSTGRCVHYYPRKKMVALNGNRRIPLILAVAIMRKHLASLAQ